MSVLPYDSNRLAAEAILAPGEVAIRVGKTSDADKFTKIKLTHYEAGVLAGFDPQWPVLGRTVAGYEKMSRRVWNDALETALIDGKAGEKASL